MDGVKRYTEAGVKKRKTNAMEKMERQDDDDDDAALADYGYDYDDDNDDDDVDDDDDDDTDDNNDDDCQEVYASEQLYFIKNYILLISMLLLSNCSHMSLVQLICLFDLFEYALLFLSI